MTAHYDTPAAAVRAHEELYAYWQTRRPEGRLPSRADISPEGFKRHLPGVSLTEVIHGGARFRFRLAGTGLYRVYGREITGLSLEGAFPSRAADAWSEELQKVVATRKPGAGAHSLAWRGSEHLTVLWLRLPLSSDGRRVDMLLGFDALVGSLANRDHSGIRAA